MFLREKNEQLTTLVLLKDVHVNVYEKTTFSNEKLAKTKLQLLTIYSLGVKEKKKLLITQTSHSN